MSSGTDGRGDTTRRDTITSGGTVVGGSLLAGCGGDGGAAGTPRTEEPTATSTAIERTEKMRDPVAQKLTASGWRTSATEVSEHE